MPLGNSMNYKVLRRKYPQITYQSYHWEVKNNILSLKFHFRLGNEFTFCPSYQIDLKRWSLDHLEKDFMDCIVFNIGMVEIISYWKTACPSTVHIIPLRMTTEEQKWWRKLFYYGLGEFFYLNDIKLRERDFLKFTFEEKESKSTYPFEIPVEEQGVLIPVGGGKDSAVTLEMLKSRSLKNVAFAINPGKATLNSISTAGLEKDFFEVRRTLDPLLLELNSRGFLNGHTPFSALVAFVGVLGAAITQNKHIALSNESSANEPTIPGTHVNHQYSKSFIFEKDFRSYVSRYITRNISYFSLLRPLNELQIGSVFSRSPQYFSIFRSCNVGSKKNVWCCNCPKCLFTWIVLAPFMKTSQLVEIFGENLMEKESMIFYLDQLCGLSPEKPFECVGTLTEVNSALTYLVSQKPDQELSLLLKSYKSKTSQILFPAMHQQLAQWNSYNSLLDEFELMVKDALVRSLQL